MASAWLEALIFLMVQCGSPLLSNLEICKKWKADSMKPDWAIFLAILFSAIHLGLEYKFQGLLWLLPSTAYHMIVATFYVWLHFWGLERLWRLWSCDAELMGILRPGPGSLIILVVLLVIWRCGSIPEFNAQMLGPNVKQCPGCRVRTYKDGGCNHMTCRCGHQYCWLCMRAWWTCRCSQH